MTNHQQHTYVHTPKMSLSPSMKATIKSSIPAVQSRGVALSPAFSFVTPIYRLPHCDFGVASSVTNKSPYKISQWKTMQKPRLKPEFHHDQPSTTYHVPKMSFSLSPSTKETIKSTIPTLKSHGTEMIQIFYNTLFARYPSMKQQFNVDRISPRTGTPAQVTALGNTVLLYAQKIDDIERLATQLRPIAEKHVSRGVTSDQYDAIGECLLAAMEEVLGEGCEGVLAAWEQAYVVLKNVFVEMEDSIKKEHEASAGWSGMKEVVIGDIRRQDGGLVMKFVVKVNECQPGMFVSVKMVVEGEETMASVKIVGVQEDGFSVLVEEKMGKASLQLMGRRTGDRVSISVPCGISN